MDHPGAVDSLAMVGTAQETDSAHAERHPVSNREKWAKVCRRCCFLKWKKGKRCSHWLSPKPNFMKGAWGLGCTYCAAARLSAQVQDRRALHMKLNKKAGRCKQAISRAGVWSTYEWRASLTPKTITLLVDQHETGGRGAGLLEERPEFPARGPSQEFSIEFYS